MKQNHSFQEHLHLTIESKKYTLEFIKHSGYYYYIYINGSLTDVTYPSHQGMTKRMKRYKIFKNLTYGKSEYNKKIIKSVFMEIIPEYFL